MYIVTNIYNDSLYAGTYNECIDWIKDHSSAIGQWFMKREI